MLATRFLSCLLILALASVGYAQQSAASDSDAKFQPLRISGLVTAQQKYTIEILDAKEKTHQIRFSPQTEITLRMSKPYFDWEAGKVFVEPVRMNAVESDDIAASDETIHRVPIRIPGQQHYLIAGFRTEDHLQRTMQADIKRINYYLITPEAIPPHTPTVEELYICGQLQTSPEPVKEQQVLLQVGETTHRARLGYRTATMNGFAITDLEPGTTRVTIVGTRDLKTRVITATTVAFEPVIKEGE